MIEHDPHDLIDHDRAHHYARLKVRRALYRLNRSRDETERDLSVTNRATVPEMRIGT